MNKTNLGKSIKWFPVFLLLFLISIVGYCQKSELGFNLGALSYTGDLHRNYRFLQNRPAGSVFYRVNFNNTLSLKTGMMLGKLVGNDDNPVDVLGTNRKATFSVFIMEAAATFEYHFLEWRSAKSNLRWSPYLFFGAGLFNVSGQTDKTEQYSNVQPVLPFGLGFKYIVNPKWYIGIDFGSRKTFFDYLDNISAGNISNKNYQYGFTEDNDMYHFIGFSLNYSFYDIPCPFPYK